MFNTTTQSVVLAKQKARQLHSHSEVGSFLPSVILSNSSTGYSILLRGTTDKSQSPFTVSLDGHSQDVPLPSSNENGGDDNCLFWYQAGLDQSVQHTVAVTNAASSGLIISEFSYAEILKPDE